MGGGSYSTTARSKRAVASGYSTKSIQETFSQRNINSAMSPHGIQFRESRDSNEHPNSVAIIIGLDVTGSMGSVPHFLVKKGLPDIMESVIERGTKDPQVLFLGIGDHECDRSPLQVGQFESSDELLDKWLTDVYLEGGGGANGGESYLLAWYFAAFHTQIDCLEKRNQKGFLFTIGDEPVLQSLSSRDIKELMGPGQYQDFTASELYEKAREKYNVFHIHVKSTSSGSRQSVIDGWSQIVNDNLLVVNRPEDISNAISNTVSDFNFDQTDPIKNTEADVHEKQEPSQEPDEEEVIL